MFYHSSTRFSHVSISFEKGLPYSYEGLHDVLIVSMITSVCYFRNFEDDIQGIVVWSVGLGDGKAHVTLRITGA